MNKNRLPEQFERLESGDYVGSVVVARRRFCAHDEEREFAIVAPDDETLVVVWERLMNIDLDKGRIQRVRLTNP